MTKRRQEDIKSNPSVHPVDLTLVGRSDASVSLQAVTPEFKAYQEQVLSNSTRFAKVSLLVLVMPSMVASY